MLCHAVPGCEDTVLPEELVKGGSNVLEVSLPCIVLRLLHCPACGHHPAPCLHLIQTVENHVCFAAVNPLDLFQMSGVSLV